MSGLRRGLALARQLRASSPFVGQGVPMLSSAPSVSPAAAFAAEDAVSCVPPPRSGHARADAETQALGALRRSPGVSPNWCVCSSVARPPASAPLAARQPPALSLLLRVAAHS